MVDKWMDKDVIQWYQQYLGNRISIIELKGKIKQFEIKSGTPQGGILSVILWNMAFDQLLKMLRGKRVKVIGFADDGSLLIQGKNIKYMFRLMQKAINTANKWVRDNGLTLSPEKTVAVLFNRKQK